MRQSKLLRSSYNAMKRLCRYEQCGCGFTPQCGVSTSAGWIPSFFLKLSVAFDCVIAQLHNSWTSTTYTLNLTRRGDCVDCVDLVECAACPEILDLLLVERVLQLSSPHVSVQWLHRQLKVLSRSEMRQAGYADAVGSTYTIEVGRRSEGEREDALLFQIRLVYPGDGSGNHGYNSQISGLQSGMLPT